MKKCLLCVLISLTGSLVCRGQRLPFFTHHVLNPYIYNPAFAGYEQSAVFYLTHRRQWMGVEGAPVSTHLSFHTPVGNKNPISLGGDLVHDRIGLLRHSAVKATLAYLVPLSSEKVHYLKFGLSAGAGAHQYDLSDTDYGNDEAIAQAAQSAAFLDARFGLLYHHENLNIGLALPHLLAPPVQVEAESNLSLDPLSRAIASVSYRFNLGETEELAFTPTVLYNYAQEGESQLEAIALLEFQRAFWVGGGYQQQMGFGALAGFRMKNFTFSYAYGTGGNELAAYASGTHEAQLGFTIGKKKAIIKRQPRLIQTGDDAIPEAKVRGRKRRKQKEETPDRKKAPEQAEPQESFDDDSFREVEQGIILIPSEDEQNPLPDLQPKSNVPGAVPTEPQSESNANEQNTDIDVSDDSGALAPVSDTDSDDTNSDLDNTWEGEGDVDPWQGIEDEPSAAPPPSFEKSADWAITKVKTVESNHPLEMKGGTYIIAGTFSQRPYADRLAQKLARQGYGTKVGYNTAKGYYYVSLFESADLDDTKKRLYRARSNPALEKAWILVIE